MVIVVTIDAPSSAEVGTSFKVSGTVRDDGEFLSGAAVSIYVNNNYVTGATTDINGYYSKNINISEIGVYTLKATAVGASASRSIIIYYIPYVSSVTIDAPSSVQTGQSFTVSGQVKDQYGYGYGGVTVKLYRNTSLFASIFADSNGYYSRTTSISMAGTYTLKAVADSKQATRSITVTTPKPPPGPFTSIMDFVVPASLPAGATVTVSVLVKNTGGVAGRLEVYIDGNPREPDELDDTVGTGTTPSDIQPGASMWLDITFSSMFNMPDWNYILTARNYEGTSQISKTISLSTAPPVGIPTTLTISAPDKVGLGETFNIIGQLTRNDTGVAIPNANISVSYNGTPLGSKDTDMQGVYTIPASIPTAGTYTLKAAFAGTPGYAASTSIAGTIVAATHLEAVIKIAVPAVTGLALIIYGLR